MCVGIVAVLVLGFVGGLRLAALFPATLARQGKQEPVGEAGPAGPAGDAANINLSNIGYCINVHYTYSGSVGYVDTVGITAPV